jgi:hypothetical protein
MGGNEMKQTNLEWLLDQTAACINIGVQKKYYKEFNCDGESLIRWLASPRIEPIVLTAAERKAAELAVAIGLPWIRKTQRIHYISELEQMSPVYAICDIPGIKPLCEISRYDDGSNVNPIDLRELL